MSWTVSGRSASVGEEWARHLFYGPDSKGETPLLTLKALLSQVGRDLVEGLGTAAAEIESFRALAGAQSTLDSTVTCLRDAEARLRHVFDQLAERDVDLPFRVVLMGRTKAGKSTLFEYLSGGSGDLVGDGRQRFTRHAQRREALGLGIEIVDTPGVGAYDGEEDYAAAFAEVANADLVLWVAPTQATQAETGEALERLADMGKPILVALNCLKDVTNEDGLLDLVEEPELVFGGDAEGNLAPIRRHLARAGGMYLDAVPFHAQAALLSVRGELDERLSAVLRTNSRIDALVSALADQRDRTATQRRVISLFDAAQIELTETSSALVGETLALQAAYEAMVGSRESFRTRALRRVQDAADELQGTFTSEVRSRERWIEEVDVDQPAKEINRRWAKEVDTLRVHLAQATASIGDRLVEDLRTIAVDVAEDWAQFEPGGFKNLGLRGAIWGNRAVKAGGRVMVGIAGTIGGAKAGALIGTFFGPGVGNAVGLALGAVVGLVAALLGVNRLIDWLGDRAFTSATELHARRRKRMREQLSPLLTQLELDLGSAALRVREDWTAAVQSELSRQSQVMAALPRAIGKVEKAAEQIESGIGALDAELSREILMLTGRSRNAESVRKATRWRGAGYVVDLPEPCYSELVLFPPSEAVERIMPVWVGDAPATQALHIMRNLSEQAITVKHMDEHRLVLSYPDPLPAGVREAWESLARAHTGIHVRIDQGDR